jgi:hypothetical protein
LLSDQAQQAGGWLLLDRGLPAFLTPLVWALRIEPGQTREVAVNAGLQLVREKTRHDDVFRIVEARSGTEIRFDPGDLYIGFRGERRFSVTLPVPEGRYTVQWKRRSNPHWYTVVDDHEFDGKSLVTLQF